MLVLYIALSPRAGWNRKGLETIYDMCVGPAMFLVLVLTLHTCAHVRRS